MKFELGKYYKHSAGKKMFIAGVMSSFYYGVCFIGEDEFGHFTPVGKGESHAVNYAEITKEEFAGLAEKEGGNEIMTVEELIEKLSKCDKSKSVYVNIEWQYAEISKVSEGEEVVQLEAD